MQGRADLEDEDSACMLRLKEGQDLALNEIMSRWQQRLVNYLMRCLGNETDALDLAQETFVRVYENRHRYESRAAFSSWLFRIATNLARSQIRWRTRHPAVAIETAFEGEGAADVEPPSADPGAGEILIKKENTMALRAAMRQLDADSRTVLLLFEFEEQSYQQIATILGCTPKAVEGRLYRARQALRDVLLASTPHLL